MKYFDTHAHYEDDTFLENQQEVLQNCREAGVTYIVNVGCNVASSQKSVALANSHSYIYAAIGIHPHDVGKDSVESLKRIYEDSNANKIVAIGEIGLDYAFVKENKKEQIELFEEQIMLANQFKLPVVIHARDAALDTYETIMRRKPEYGALFHCFQPSDDLVRLVLQEGYFVAFGGNITYKRNAMFQQYMDQLPISQIVIETDAPYLAPVPVRGSINTSANLPYIAKRLAEYKRMDQQEMEEIVFKNSLKFFHIQ